MIPAHSAAVTRPLPSPASVLDPNNHLKVGPFPEFQLQLGEGTYDLTDDLILGAVAAHPAEALASPPHVLDSKPFPPTTGAQLSLTIIAASKTASRPKSSQVVHSLQSSTPTSISEAPQDASKSSSEAGSNPLSNLASGNLRAFVFDGIGAAVQSGGKDGKEGFKRRKPKSNLSKSGSSFISRVVTADGLSKRLQERSADGLLMFVNNSRSLQWLDLSSTKKADALTKILFTRAHPLCHDVNQSTKTVAHLDVVLGYSTADIVWYEPFSQKYSRLNKNGMVNATPMSRIKWIPGSESIFVAAHFDGQVVMYDKEREDASFIPDEGEAYSSSSQSSLHKRQPQLVVRKSLRSREQKTNPVALWRLSKQRLNDLAFSPDGRFLAVAAEDGCLRIIDILQEKLLDQFPSYYGGFTCVCWSPDGRYLITGGQDDLVSIWSFEDRSLVARCLGHRSWVTALSFDAWRCDGRSYRFGSVGEDCRLILWEFSEGILNRPRAASVRPSISSHVQAHPDGALHAEQLHAEKEDNLVNGANDVHEDEIGHAVQPRAHVLMLPPVMSKKIDDHALSWITFEEDSIMTACRGGHIRVWKRP